MAYWRSIRHWKGEMHSILLTGFLIVAVAAVGSVIASFRRRVGLTAVFAAVLFGARLVLVGYGYVYDPTLVRALDVLVGVAVLLVAASLRGRLADKDATGEQRVALVASLVGVPVAAVALAQLLTPATPKESDTATCTGTPVAGAALKARTGEFGLNARAGPATSYPPRGRFDKGCVIGVDGYCVGEGVRDVVVPLPDVRWLRLRHSSSYVAAGPVFALDPESELGRAPQEDCPEHQADPALAARPTVKRLDKSTLLFTAKPVRTTLVGFAMYYEGTGPERYEQLGITPKLVAPTTQLVYGRFPVADVRAGAGGVRYVDVAVVPCLAPVVPSHAGPGLLRIDLTTGAAVTLTTVPKDRLERLKQEGCRIDPSASNDDIAKRAPSQIP